MQAPNCFAFAYPDPHGQLSTAVARLPMLVEVLPIRTVARHIAWFPAVLACLLPLVTAGSVLALQGSAERARNGEVVVMELVRDLDDADALLLDTVPPPRATRPRPPSLAAKWRGRLESSVDPSPELDRLLARLDAFDAQIGRQASTVALAADADEVEAAASAVAELQRASASSTRSRAQVLTTFALILSSVSVVLLFVRFDRLRRRESRDREAALRYHATHDALTGLGNRSLLVHDLDAALRKPRPPASFALFDLDGFERLNDEFGHHLGDEVLTLLGRRLAQAVAPNGRAYRLGGDEFCVLLSGEAPELTRDACQVALSLTDPVHISASRGWVALPSEAAAMDAALRLADTRMYAYKRARSVPTPALAPVAS